MTITPVRALVTGGAGFLGSGLVDRLIAEGHSVEVIDDLSCGSLANLADARASVGAMRFHQMDVCQPACVELVARLRPEVVFHLAAPPGEEAGFDDPVLQAEVGVVGLIRVLEGARAAGSRKIVFASSWTSYGPLEADDLPVREHLVARPRSAEGVAKRAALDLLAGYREQHGLEFSALALASVYGPRQLGASEPGAVASLVAALVAHRPWAVGDRARTRDFLFVDDAVDACARAAERGSGLLINVASGEETSLEALAHEVARVGGAPVRLAGAPARPTPSARVALDPSRAEIHLGWRPFTPLADGLAVMLDAAHAALPRLAPASGPTIAGDPQR